MSMGKVKIMVFTDFLQLTRRWVSVEGYPVVFKGFENYDFVVHASPEEDLALASWRVSETSTGMYFGSGETKLQAIDEAFAKLQLISNTEFGYCVYANIEKAAVIPIIKEVKDD